MAIPSDLASRLQALITASIQPLAAITELPADLPDLGPGQRFTAEIRALLPDGNYRARVAGRELTLALPHVAQEGDVLELVVSATRQHTVHARLAQTPQADADAQGALRTQLSPAAQLISQLLTGRYGESAPLPLARGAPLLATPPAPASTGQLAAVLRQAVSESGLFYEAHQAQWVEGDLPLELLRREPQAQLASAPASTPSRAAEQAPPPALPPPLAAERALATTGPSESDPQSVAALTAQAAHAARLGVPEATLPVVHQQLDTLATQQAVWQGQLWPGQTLQLAIEEREYPGGGNGGGEPAREWRSTLRLQLPSLGGLDAQLILTPAGLAVRIAAEDAQAAQRLRAGQAALEQALEAAGLTLTALAVEQHVRA